MALIQPLDVNTLECIQIGAELESVGLVEGSKEEDIQRLAKDVMTLCAEIKRLRYTYGEPWWQPVDKTDEDIAAERRQYEASRNSGISDH